MRIFNFTLAMVGWIRSGLGHVNVGASIEQLFAAEQWGTAPFLISQVIVPLLVTFVPGLTMWLPTLFYR